MSKPKIVFADHTIIDALRSYVDEVVDNLCIVLGSNNPKTAMITDESTIRCFLPYEDTGKRGKVRDPFRKGEMREAHIVTYNTKENQEILVALSNRLGLKITLNDLIYEIAIKLRDKP